MNETPSMRELTVEDQNINQMRTNDAKYQEQKMSPSSHAQKEHKYTRSGDQNIGINTSPRLSSVQK